MQDSLIRFSYALPVLKLEGDYVLVISHLVIRMRRKKKRISLKHVNRDVKSNSALWLTIDVAVLPKPNCGKHERSLTDNKKHSCSDRPERPRIGQSSPTSLNLLVRSSAVLVLRSRIPAVANHMKGVVDHVDRGKDASGTSSFRCCSNSPT